MSKLQEKLEKVNKALSTSMSGFGFLAAHAKEPTMLIMSSLREPDKSLASSCIEKGADEVLLSCTEATVSKVKGLVENLTVPWGIEVDELSSDSLSSISKAGADFLGIKVEAPASVLADENLGRLLHITVDNVEDSDLRTMSGLRLDAVAVELPQALSVGGIAFVLRIAMLTGKPVLVEISKQELSSAELQVLRDAGVKGILFNIGSKSDVDRLSKLRKLIDDLPQRAKRADRGGASALVPQAVMPREVPPTRPEPDEDE